MVRFALFVVAVWPAIDARGLSAAPRIEPADKGKTVTYRFKAKVDKQYNATPFAIGDEIEGEFTYDLESKMRRPDSPQPRNVMESSRNTVSFKVGKQQFTGMGIGWLSVTETQHAETLVVGTRELRLPDGWKVNEGKYPPGFCVMFQNAPPRNVIQPTGIPHRIKLDDFVDTREFRLDFMNGLEFPGGKTVERVTVHCNIESLTLVENVRPK